MKLPLKFFADIMQGVTLIGVYLADHIAKARHLPSETLQPVQANCSLQQLADPEGTAAFLAGALIIYPNCRVQRLLGPVCNGEATTGGAEQEILVQAEGED